MKKRFKFRILSILIALSIIVSPISSVVNHVVMAEEVAEEAIESEASDNVERLEELKKLDELEEEELEESEEEDLQRAADILEVTIQNTDNKLTSPVTDGRWIRLLEHDKGGDYGIWITWKSSDSSFISVSDDMGFVTLPEVGEKEVRLTATLNKGGYKTEKHFDYVLIKNKPLESEDEKYISDAIKSMTGVMLKINSDADKNVRTNTKSILESKGFADVDVSVKSSNNEDYIDLNGDIHFIFDESYLRGGLPSNRQVALNFEFSKGEAKKEFSLRTMVGWDRNKVKNAIENNIITPLSNDLVGNNESLGTIKEDFEVPTRIKYTEILWESSDEAVLRVEPENSPLAPRNINITRGSEDKKVELTATVKFNHDDSVVIIKKYNLNILALEDAGDTTEAMQRLLDKNYTVNKLRDFVNKQPVDPKDIKNDISLLTPGKTGIEGYDNYKFKVTSDSEEVVINNYRANVYRPLPGELAKDANLTVRMEHKKKDITVTKVIPITITPISQQEINDEIALMELAKENYFQGIKGDNTNANEITSDLKSFKEMNLIDGELVWTYHINDYKDAGIFPDELEGSENQEQWRVFRSSKPNVIKHENLLVTKPEYTTDVKIDSILSSKLFGKYAVKYPEKEDFKKLYRQGVSATVTVIGEKEGVPEPEVKEISVGVAIIVFDKEGDFSIHKAADMETIEKDKYDGGFTVFGALQATTDEYEGTGGWVASIGGITGPSTGGWMFTVNGKVPNVGAGQVRLKAGDKVIWFCTYDYKRDTAPTWEDLTGNAPDKKPKIKIASRTVSVKANETLELTAQVSKGDTVLTDQKVKWESSNLEVATITTDGKFTAHKPGGVIITVTLAEDESVQDTIEINVANEDEEEITIEKAVQALREYYSRKNAFTFRSALGYNHTSDNLEKDLVEISSKFKLNKNPTSASEHVGNVMGLIAAGKDPYSYNDKNYVGSLAKSQNTEGKFIIGEYDDYPTTQAFSILALDMANADYNKDKAMEAILGYQDTNGSFGGVDETGMVLGALGKYRDDSQVNTAINQGLAYLKGEQDEMTGGFIAHGSENPYSASAVLQGLIAVGEDPLSTGWTKGEKTIVDSLLSFYKDGHFEKESEWNPEPDVDSITEQGFIALADVLKGKSMFNELEFNANPVVRIEIKKPSIDRIIVGNRIKLYVTGYDSGGKIVPTSDLIWTSSNEDIATMDLNGNISTEKVGEVTLTAQIKGTEIKDSIEIEVLAVEFTIEYVGDTSVEKGKQADAKVKIKNLTSNEKPATLIIGLYDKKNRTLENYSTIKRNLINGEEIELSAGFLVPEIGEHYIQIFLWEDLEKQNIIMNESKEIKITN